MKELYKRRIKHTVRLIVLLVLMCILPQAGNMLSEVSKAFEGTGRDAEDVIVIDPGHGGFDGGAESAKGTAEKDINLAISMRLKEMAEKDGFEVVMTRNTDTALNTSDAGSIRSKKTSDLIARKEIIDKRQPILAVSIHLNSFKQDTSVHGAQVFYPAGDEEETVIAESKRLAETIRAELIAGMNDGTERIALAKNDVRILKNVKSPTVLVECGFLSNAEEAKNLENADYQQKLAEYIYSGILKYTGKNPNENSDNFMFVVDSRFCSD